MTSTATPLDVVEAAKENYSAVVQKGEATYYYGAAYVKGGQYIVPYRREQVIRNSNVPSGQETKIEYGEEVFNANAYHTTEEVMADVPKDFRERQQHLLETGNPVNYVGQNNPLSYINMQAMANQTRPGLIGKTDVYNQMPAGAQLIGFNPRTGEYSYIPGSNPILPDLQDGQYQPVSTLKYGEVYTDISGNLFNPKMLASGNIELTPIQKNTIVNAKLQTSQSSISGNIDIPNDVFNQIKTNKNTGFDTQVFIENMSPMGYARYLSNLGNITFNPNATLSNNTNNIGLFVLDKNKPSILIDNNLSNIAKENVASHELTHYLQFTNFGYDKDLAIINNESTMPYMQRPSEIKAYAQESPYASYYVKTDLRLPTDVIVNLAPSLNAPGLTISNQGKMENIFLQQDESGKMKFSFLSDKKRIINEEPFELITKSAYLPKELNNSFIIKNNFPIINPGMQTTSKGEVFYQENPKYLEQIVAPVAFAQEIAFDLGSSLVLGFGTAKALGAINSYTGKYLLTEGTGELLTISRPAFAENLEFLVKVGTPTAATGIGYQTITGAEKAEESEGLAGLAKYGLQTGIGFVGFGAGMKIGTNPIYAEFIEKTPISKSAITQPILINEPVYPEGTQFENQYLVGISQTTSQIREIGFENVAPLKQNAIGFEYSFSMRQTKNTIPEIMAFIEGEKERGISISKVGSQTEIIFTQPDIVTKVESNQPSLFDKIVTFDNFGKISQSSKEVLYLGSGEMPQSKSLADIIGMGNENWESTDNTRQRTERIMEIKMKPVAFEDFGIQEIPLRSGSIFILENPESNKVIKEIPFIDTSLTKQQIIDQEDFDFGLRNNLAENDIFGDIRNQKGINIVEPIGKERLKYIKEAKQNKAMGNLRDETMKDFYNFRKKQPTLLLKTEIEDELSSLEIPISSKPIFIPKQEPMKIEFNFNDNIKQEKSFDKIFGKSYYGFPKMNNDNIFGIFGKVRSGYDIIPNRYGKNIKEANKGTQNQVTGLYINTRQGILPVINIYQKRNLQIIQVNTNKNKQIQIQVPKQEQENILGLKQIQIQVPKQELILESKLIQKIRKPIIPIPNIDITDDIFNLSPQRKRKTQQTKKGYKVLIKRKGQFFTLPGSYSFNTALDIGAKKTAETLSATFKIEPTNQEASEIQSTGDFSRLGSMFRNYMIRKGKRIPLYNEFIQKRSKRLSSPFEVQEIKGARRNTSRKAKKLRKKSPKIKLNKLLNIKYRQNNIL